MDNSRAFRQAGQRQSAAADPEADCAGSGSKAGKLAHQHTVSPPSMPQRNCAPHCGHRLVDSSFAEDEFIVRWRCRSAGKRYTVRSTRLDGPVP